MWGDGSAFWCDWHSRVKEAALERFPFGMHTHLMRVRCISFLWSLSFLCREKCGLQRGTLFGRRMLRPTSQNLYICNVRHSDPYLLGLLTHLGFFFISTGLMLGTNLKTYICLDLQIWSSLKWFLGISSEYILCLIHYKFPSASATDSCKPTSEAMSTRIMPMDLKYSPAVMQSVFNIPTMWHEARVVLPITIAGTAKLSSPLYWG